MLKSRHVFKGNQSEVALALFEVYFGEDNRATFFCFKADCPIILCHLAIRLS
ncbi:hypothetical protein [Nostoc sp.]|uniref:hypothetical protein n=1 Tax=Nostoc sp. TaxID=1180 RepID=UPI002FF61B09